METWTIVGTIAAILLPVIAEFGGFTSLRKGVLLNYQTKRKRIMVLTDEVSDLLQRRDTISNYKDPEPKISAEKADILEYARYLIRMSNKEKIVGFLTSEIESTIRRSYNVLSESRMDRFLRLITGVQIVALLGWWVYIQFKWGFFGDLDEWASRINKIVTKVSIGLSVVVIVTVDIRRWWKNKTFNEAVDREIEKVKEEVVIDPDESGRRS